jgi:hypothetical protein
VAGYATEFWTRSKQRFANSRPADATRWETRSMTHCGTSLAPKAFCVPASTNPISLGVGNILSIVYARLNKWILFLRRMVSTYSVGISLRSQEEPG